MKIDVTSEEYALLLDLLEREIGNERVELRHTDTPAFKDAVRDKEQLLETLFEKLKASAGPEARTA